MASDDDSLSDGSGLESVEEEVDFEQLARDLLKAVKARDLPRARDLVEQGAPMDARDGPTSWTPLTWAATLGEVETLHMLLDAGAGQDYPQERARAEAAAAERPGAATGPVLPTPLHAAASKGHARALWLLLLKGYSPEDLDEVENTALHCASMSGDVESVRTLLMQGAVLERRNALRNTAADVAGGPEVRAILRRAEDEVECAQCGVEFPAGARKYLCHATGGFFCEDCSVEEVVVVDTRAEETRPVRLSRRAVERIRETEAKMDRALMKLMEAKDAEAEAEAEAYEQDGTAPAKAVKGERENGDGAKGAGQGGAASSPRAVGPSGADEAGVSGPDADGTSKQAAAVRSSQAQSPREGASAPSGGDDGVRAKRSHRVGSSVRALERSIAAAREAGATPTAVAAAERQVRQVAAELAIREAAAALNEERPIRRRRQARPLLDALTAGRVAGASAEVLRAAATTVRASFAEASVLAASAVCKGYVPATLAQERETAALEEAVAVLRRLDGTSTVVGPAEALARRMRAEIELVRALQPHEEQEDGHFVVGDRELPTLLLATRLRTAAIDAALIEGRAASADKELVEGGAAVLEALKVELEALEAEEAERLRVEEEERLKRERKARRKKGKGKKKK